MSAVIGRPPAGDPDAPLIRHSVLPLPVQPLELAWKIARKGM
jgi:hypothetical protein